MTCMSAPSSRPGSVETLARLSASPDVALPGCSTTRRIGSLHVWETVWPGNEPGRYEIFLSCQDHFTLLVDQFKFSETRPVELLVESPVPLHGGRHRYRCQLPGLGEVTLHILGDYALERRSDRQLVLRQQLAHGRFLIAVTRDPEARVRTLNGWSIEVRTGEQLYQLLHSNRAGKMRPLGSVQTDARYALADAPRSDESLPVMLDVRLQAIQATQLHADLRDAKPPPAPDWVI